jgi:putative membrane protein
MTAPSERSRRAIWSPVRVASGLVLAVWAALFWFLMISGRSALYLSPRTAWVIPVGAVLLTTGAVGRLASARRRDPEPLGRREAAGMALVALPVVLVLALPPATLGSFAAGRRSAIGGAGFVSTEDISAGRISLTQVAAALRSPGGMQALVERAGSRVSFVGFVDRDEGMPADEFVLTRFLISCCVADALTVQVRVVGAPPGELRPDEWVRVSGTLYPLGEEVLVQASSVERVPRPEEPYLNP